MTVEERNAVLEEAARAVCPFCDLGHPPVAIMTTLSSPAMFHQFSVHPAVQCKAERIHHLKRSGP